MICMKLRCCFNCNIREECPMNCGIDNPEVWDSVAIRTKEEFEEVYCVNCSFRDCKGARND